jgi:6-pyruvoyltetrahydropterin/6-carboxytetrahydropterin synthase
MALPTSDPSTASTLRPAAIRLRRAVRFWIGGPTPMPHHGGFGGLPAPSGLVATFELEVEVLGEPDPTTGYLIGIQHLDAAVRETIVPRFAEAFRHGDADPIRLLLDAARRLGQRLPVPLSGLLLRLTPFHAIEWLADPAVPEGPAVHQASAVLLRQRFEFAASHRLHCPDLDDAANREVFGKCNNPHGHGHNYKVETWVEAPLAGTGGPSMPAIEAVVGREVIDRFDHRHLNLDCEEFRTLNPSVEHIAAVAYGRLREPIAALGGNLRSVTVWETDKTSATYPA